jgi:HK97 family phage major capsid protein
MNNFETKSTFNNLQQTFAHFKDANDELIEQKAQPDVITVEKLTKIETELEGLEQKLNDLHRNQRYIQRSQSFEENIDERRQSPNQEQQNFSHFIRKGIDHVNISSSFAEHSATDNGYLVPEQTHILIQNIINNYSIMRMVSNTLTISNGDLSILMQDEEITTAWTNDGNNNPANPTTLNKVSIPVHELYAEPRITQKLLDDCAFNVESWISERVGAVMGKAENEAFINGDGLNKPKGILHYDDNDIDTLITGVDGQWPSANAADLLIDLVHSLPSYFLDQAVWIMNRQLMADIRKMKIGTDYIWQPSSSDSVPATLFGHHVYTTDAMPVKDDDSLSIIFGNFKRGYTVVDKDAMRILRDPYTNKPYVKFYTTKFTGGDVIDAKAIKRLRFTA